ncbi:hypothetical protein LTS18_011755 [Coniosporium uncinatum]|uniref:Uncharacterized protein n=1 Tax=Coniosporium uncinatum TaxID=93489 RepID=A0ACC3DBY4_9PEZI|nr:hypothetical protein LTS18_011755 [Coniosporium uncinatum]
MPVEVKRYRQVTNYLQTNNVQLGATYNIGKESTRKVSQGTIAGAAYINARTPEVVIGRSTTQLFRNLSVALKFQPGDELILSKFGHEANIAPWVSIAARSNLTVKWWTGDVDRTTSNPKFTLASLKPLLSDRTRLVTCTHASNVLGNIHDIKALAETVHTIPGAMLCVDAVAYAPHGRLDVKALDV